MATTKKESATQIFISSHFTAQDRLCWEDIRNKYQNLPRDKNVRICWNDVLNREDVFLQLADQIATLGQALIKYDSPETHRKLHNVYANLKLWMASLCHDQLMTTTLMEIFEKWRDAKETLQFDKILPEVILDPGISKEHQNTIKKWYLPQQGLFMLFCDPKNMWLYTSIFEPFEIACVVVRIVEKELNDHRPKNEEKTWAQSIVQCIVKYWDQQPIDFQENPVLIELYKYSKNACTRLSKSNEALAPNVFDMLINIMGPEKLETLKTSFTHADTALEILDDIEKSV